MLSVIIICKNEAFNIRRCLESVSFADEIIVLDSGSTDETVSIAQEFTDHVFINEDWQGYGIQKQRALSLATKDWVLNIDADESISDALKEAIMHAIQSNAAEAYRIPICMHFYGQLMRYSSSPTRHVRLFKRQDARFSNDIVHEKIVLPQTTRIAKLKIPIMHHSFRDVTHALTKINRYSSYSAKIRLKTQKPPSMFKILSSTAWMFCRCFYLQLGFMDGYRGFLLAVFNAQGTFYRGIKQLYPDVRATIPPVKSEEEIIKQTSEDSTNPSQTLPDLSESDASKGTKN